ncbi:MAG: spore photoproduct lyase [Vulcanimicrobiaceae bacterium]
MASLETQAIAPHLYPDAGTEPIAVPDGAIPAHAPKRWIPKRVLVTRAALAWPLARTIAERAAALGSEVVELRADRLEGLRGSDERATYALAKSTLAVVVSPPSHRKLQPIPPSADWQFHLARGCPAHCQYCYLAGSLAGPPVTRVYANLPEILDGLHAYLGTGEVTSKSAERAAEGTTFEASCYTDPLALEHLTGALATTIAHFGAWQAPVQLRWTTKFDNVAALVPLAHNGRTRVRFSVNARTIARRFEGGTASLDDRLDALATLARASYPVGLTIAPIMPLPHWRDEYDELLRAVADRTGGIEKLDLSVELITHRFTPGSKDVLLGWYPATQLEMDEAARSQKRTKFGSLKYVYRKDVMSELKAFFSERIGARLPHARVLYWT